MDPRSEITGAVAAPEPNARARQVAYVNGLHDLADFLANHLDLVPQYSRVKLNLFADDPAEFKRLSTRLGGYRSKAVVGEFVEHSRRFGPHTLDVNIHREKTCERVVTGRRTIPARPESVEEIVEWRCPEGLL